MYYIYEILDDEGCPLYVGQTLNMKRRLAEHRDCCTEGNNSEEAKKWLYKKLRKLKREKGYKFTFSILEEGLTPEQANEREKYWIAFYGRSQFDQGPLLNLTDGGEGTPGRAPVFTEEWRTRLSIAAKARVTRLPGNMLRASLAAKEKAGEAKRLKAWRETILAKYEGRAPNLGKKLETSEEARQNASRRMKLFASQPRTEEWKRKISKANKGKSRGVGAANVNTKPIKVTMNDETFIWTEGARLLCQHLKERWGLELVPGSLVIMARGETKESLKAKKLGLTFTCEYV